MEKRIVEQVDNKDKEQNMNETRFHRKIKVIFLCIFLGY